MISIGYVIGMCVAVLLLAAGAVTFVIACRKQAAARQRIVADRQAGHRPDFEDTDARFWLRVLAGVAVAAILATVGVTLGATWPTFDMQYHRYREVSGTILSVSSRLRDTGDGTTQSYAVRFVEHPGTYRCDDTRCAALDSDRGNRLTLWCIREWQYAGTPGWACQYGKES